MQKCKMNTKMLIIFGIIFFLVLPLMISSVSAINSPINLWHFDESSGNIAYDSVGGSNGNLINMNNSNWVSGKINGALLFDGTNEYINFTNLAIANFERTNNFSYEFWFNTTRTDMRVIMSKYDASIDKGIMIYMTAGELIFDFRGSSSGYLAVSTNNTFNNGVFHHAVITYNGTSLSNGVNIYVDGVNQNLTTDKNNLASTTLNSATFNIGRRSAGNYWLGKLDEILIYNFTLTSAEVTSRFLLNCTENWVQYNTTCGNYCGSYDKISTYYIDTNNCRTINNLPANNGTCSTCNYCTPTFSCSLFNATCSGNPPTNYNCLQANDTTSCCGTTGLSSDCNYVGNLSDFDINYQIDLLSNSSLILSSYPYVDVNTSYTFSSLIPTNNASDLKLYISDNGTWNTYNMSYTGGIYQITLIFTQIGDYPFIINGTNPCMSLTGQVQGILAVRKSYNATFCAFNQGDGSSYKNDFAYLIAEFTSSKKYYDSNLEQFITPLGFATTFKTPVFHTYYRNGCGTLKLYEPNREYAVRLFDGVATFPTTFSPPNISKTYGTNIYFGKYTFNSTGDDIRVLLSTKDIHQYRWLFNWGYLILAGLCVVGSIFLFFVIPQTPLLSIIFGLGFLTMLTLARVIIWFIYGW